MFKIVIAWIEVCPNVAADSASPVTPFRSTSGG